MMIHVTGKSYNLWPSEEYTPGDYEEVEDSMNEETNSLLLQW